MLRTVTKGRWGTGLLAGALALAGTGIGPAAAAAEPVDVVVTASSAAHAAQVVERAGGEVTAELDYLGGVAATLPSTAATTLGAHPGVDVTPDRPVELATADLADAPDVTGPDAVAGQAQLAALSLPEHWTPASGAGVGVALLDTGVADLPELEGRVVRGPDLSGDGDGIDRHGHGTFMAGLIAADGRVRDHAEPRFGVAPGAHVVSVKLAGRDGRTTMSRVLEGIGWAITHQDEHAIRVLSLSLGVPTNRAPQADPLAMAVDAAWASGLVVVTAAGNEPGKVTSPGRSSWVVTVGATDTHGTATTADDTVAEWSGAGKVTGTERPDVLAPGVSTVSLRVPGSHIDTEHPEARVGDHHFRGSGTSMSTALAAGAAAVLAEWRPFATPDDVKGALASTTRPIAGSRAGAIDLAAADDAEAHDGWRQRHPIAGPAVGEGGRTMPWNGPDAPSASEAWQRARWLDGEWQRARWLDGEWQRARWLTDDWQRARWLDGEWQRARWLDGQWVRARWLDGEWVRARWLDDEWQRARWLDEHWQRARWLEESFARARWLDAHFARARWLDDDWARARWLSLDGVTAERFAPPAAWVGAGPPETAPPAAGPPSGGGAPGRSGQAPGRAGQGGRP
jgi:serine protease AprX